MNRPYSLVVAFALACSLSGCASAYKKFYTPTMVSPDLRQGFLPYSGKTDVFPSSDLEGDADKLFRRGYLLLGRTSFEWGGNATEAQLRKQGQEVGADLILSKVDNLGAHETAVPFVQYNPGQTSTTNSVGTVNANAYNNGGGAAYVSATYSGVSTTTTPGTFSTQMIPVMVQRYSWAATFWRKAAPSVLGVRTIQLTDDLRQRLQRNSGVVVRIVRDDSPAFRANILPGDVIVTIANEDVSVSNIGEVSRRHAGTRVNLQVFRGLEEKVIPVQLNVIPELATGGKPTR